MRAALPALALVLCMGAGWPVATVPEAVDLAGHDVVIMGEVHDNPAHHANQAAWVARMQPRAVVYEMLTPDLASAARVARMDDRDLAEALQWTRRGWPDFALYAPIFRAAPDALVIGGDVSPEQLRQALREGAAAAMGDAAALYGLDVPLPPPEAQSRETLQSQAHCNALPPEALPGMVEAQRLRDAALAHGVMAALVMAGPPVAVITGNGHARTDWGLPVALRTALDSAGMRASVLSIGQFEAPPEAAPPHDVFVIAPAPDRAGDPCDAFR